MNKIEDLEAKVADLMAEISELKKFGPDYSDWVGRLVMVRDEDDKNWAGPVFLEEYSFHRVYPFRVWGDIRYEHAKLYHGPHSINMIPWSGGECPVNPDDIVLVRLGSGHDYMVTRARALCWGNDTDHRPIRAYAVLELHS